MYNEIIKDAIDIGIDGEVGVAINEATQMMSQVMARALAEQLAPSVGAEIADKTLVQLEPYGSKEVQIYTILA